MKRMMKKLFASIFILSAVIVSFAACGSDDDDEATLSLSSTISEIQFSGDGKTAWSNGTEITPSFEVVTNQATWNVTVTPAEAATWCKAEKTADGKSFTITATENTENIPPATATVTVTAGDAAPVVITVTQSKASKMKIYAAGYYLNESYNNRPCYWTDGVRTDLSYPSEALEANANSLLIHDGKIYVKGYYLDNSFNSFGCYWVDGVRTDLSFPAGSVEVRCNSIRVINGKVYAVGYCFDGKKQEDCYWVDGKRENLPEIPESTHTNCLDIASSDGKIYVVGHYQKQTYHFTPYYWVDGVRKDLSLPQGIKSSEGNSITASNGSIYVTGKYQDDSKYIACYWVDGVCKDVPVPAGAVESACFSSSVADGKLYLFGTYNNGTTDIGYYCVDKSFHELEMPESEKISNIIGTMTMTIHEGKVYITGTCIHSVSGHINNYYWVNGKRVRIDNLPDSSVFFSKIYFE